MCLHCNTYMCVFEIKSCDISFDSFLSGIIPFVDVDAILLVFLLNHYITCPPCRTDLLG